MRQLIIILCLLCSQFCRAQSFTFPKLVAQGTTIDKLTPTNWKLIDSASGDLNNDKTDDLVLVLEFDKPVTEKRAYGDNETELVKEFQKPRILAIYFRNTKTGKLSFALQNNNFMLRANEGGALGEPFKKINIANNCLNISFEGGNDWRWKLNYQFKYQTKDWHLIFANNTYYNATTGEMVDKAYNFNTRRLIETKGNLFTRSNANQTTEEILYFSQLRTFNSFRKPWTWEITKDNFL